MPNYNHYTPQSDGSYRRSTVTEPSRHPAGRPPYPTQPSKPPTPPPKPIPPKQDPPCTSPPQEPQCPPPKPEPPCTPSREDQGILSFLRGLLPRQIDAADLLVIALLLLINREECGEDSLSPLLTIALYFLL